MQSGVDPEYVPDTTTTEDVDPQDLAVAMRMRRVQAEAYRITSANETRCPNKDVDGCMDGLSAKCADCPAYTWRVRLAWWLRRILVWIAGALITFAIMAQPHVALAAHNPAHECPLQVAQAVLSGAMGGTYYGSSERVEWTNGSYVCIFTGGEAKTFFRSRNGLQYVAKDAAKKGLPQIEQSTAAKLVGLGKKLAGPAGSNLAFPIAGWTYCSMWPQNCRQPVMQ
jgi:hypothetical protein